MKTYMPKPGEVERAWHVVDLDGKVLGRAATRIAMVLRGKHKPQFAPHVDTGDFVVVINANKVRLTGAKETKKMYFKVGRKVGHLIEKTAAEMRKKHPERIIALAVKNMLPKNRLGRAHFRKLKIYAGPDHPHSAQNPQVLNVEA